MIYDVLILHRETEVPLFHSCLGSESKLTSMGLDGDLFAKLMVTVVRALRRAGALDRLILREAKVALLVYEDLIFALVTSTDHDEFEINYALERLSSLFLQSYTKDVIQAYKNRPGSFNAMDIRSIFRGGRVLIGETDALMKSMLKRLADMVQVAGRLQQDAAILAEKRNLDGTVVLSITLMQQELEGKLKSLREQMGRLPVATGPEYPS